MCDCSVRVVLYFTNKIVFLQEEARVEQRRRNILVLILHYLTEEGYVTLSIAISGTCVHTSFLDTAQTFEKEVGSNIDKYVACANIDLVTILQVIYSPCMYGEIQHFLLAIIMLSYLFCVFICS